MSEEVLCKILLSKPCAVLEFPFGEDIWVFKVKKKIFALYRFCEGEIRLNLKCNIYDAKLYREIYKCVVPAYHMNKKHWNTIILNKTISDEVLIEMINDSYTLVTNNLTKKEKEALRFEKC